MYQLFIYCFALLNLFWISPAQATEEYTIINDKAKVPILTPDFADRKVLKVRLSNGLEAYLVSDPHTDKSGATMTVKVGTWEDPPEYPGTAHFLEHMLFLGTKKYPKESEYQRFVSENGGATNAFTTHTQTSYIFAINNSAFEEALDRFANFFIDPLFNVSGVARELHAIDQEYATYLENDDMRILYLDKEVASPDHPYHRFHIGNSATLSNVTQDILKQWYREHYSANLMHLVVYSSLPMETLLQLVVNDFKEIPNNSKQPFYTDKNALSENTQGHIIYSDPIKNVRILTLVWELPLEFADMKNTHPYKIACHLLGHEGEKSLIAQLKREELAEKVDCGLLRLGAKNSEFYLQFCLTDEGTQQVNTVIERIFQTIANFREKGVPRYIFDEVQRMATINYKYQTREDLFSTLMKDASMNSEEELETYPEQTMIIQQFDPDAIKALFNVLTPKRAHYYLTAPTSITEVAFDQRTKWLNIPYAIKPIEPSQLAKWTNVSPHLPIDLPSPNRLIPQQLVVINQNSTPEAQPKRIIPIPDKLVDDDRGLIYFAQDTRYHMPQISWLFEIKTPQIEMGNACKTVLADLYAKSVMEELNDNSYAANLAGLSYEIKRTDYGISLSISGYSESADLLFDQIIQKMTNLNLTEEQFNLYKEYLRREYRNFTRKPPLEQAYENLKTILFKKFTTEKQKAIAINRVSFEKFQQYLTHLFKQSYLEGTLYGNLDKKQALHLTQKLFSALESSPYPLEKRKRREVIILPADRDPSYLEVSTKAQGNAVVLAIQQPNFSFKERALQQILMQAMSEPFFDTLRTKQQTAYVVNSNAKEIEKQLFNVFAVQSNSHAPHDLLARFELFIEGYLQELRNEIPEERFEAIKQVLINVLEQPQKNIYDMGEMINKLAFEYLGDFNWMEKRIQGFKELTYPEFLEGAKAFMGRQNKRRIAILLQGVIPTENTFLYKPLGSLLHLRKNSEYSSVVPDEDED